jgi:hypothetical protein
MFILHTMVGFLQSTEDMFRRTDVGVESHFGIGGPWDGPDHDGEIRQWQDTFRQADAQWDANPFAISIETSDGGDAGRPWSSKQQDAIVQLALMAHLLDRIPFRLVTSWDDPVGGFGWHRMFPEWNHSNHSCPGDVRLAQFQTVVWPRILREGRVETMSLSDEDRAFFTDLEAKRHQDMVTLLRGESHASMDKILTTLQQIEANTRPFRVPTETTS